MQMNSRHVPTKKEKISTTIVSSKDLNYNYYVRIRDIGLQGPYIIPTYDQLRKDKGTL